uniref:Fibroblast growth factor n=1 Tax=Neogobius melanostomus TaxID=47308 RepID=A0A8C6T5G8_9GOBI
MSLQLVDVLITAGVLLSSAVMCAPLVEHGTGTGWSQVVRLRHLYAGRTGQHLLISADGGVHGSALQSPHTLLEITAVSPGCVALRGVASDRFLCIHRDATLYTSATYSRDDCTFREQILPDGYSTYSSHTHGQLLSLGTPRQRQRGQDRGLPALAQFLPRLNTLEVLPPTTPHLARRPPSSLRTTWTHSDCSLRSSTAPASTRDESRGKHGGRDWSSKFWAHHKRGRLGHDVA